jgi:hypothetical protein
MALHSANLAATCRFDNAPCYCVAALDPNCYVVHLLRELGIPGSLQFCCCWSYFGGKCWQLVDHPGVSRRVSRGLCDASGVHTCAVVGDRGRIICKHGCWVCYAMLLCGCFVFPRFCGVQSRLTVHHRVVSFRLRVYHVTSALVADRRGV